MAHFSRTTVLALVSLLVLAACASGDRVSPNMPSTLMPRTLMQQSSAQCTPDFVLSVKPTSAGIQAGSSKLYQIGLTSLCGIAGSINVGTTSISPAGGGNGPRPHQARYDIPLTANGQAGVAVTFTTSNATPKTTYTITITATDVSGGCCYGVRHAATVSLIVN